MADEKLLSTYDENGREVPDPNPVSVHVKFRRPEPLTDKIRRMIRSENVRRLAEAQELESFDEADDFEIPDDYVDPGTPWEDNFEPTIPGISARQAEIRAGIVADMPADKLIAARDMMAKWKEKRDLLIKLELEKQKLPQPPAPEAPKA